VRAVCLNGRHENGHRIQYWCPTLGHLLLRPRVRQGSKVIHCELELSSPAQTEEEAEEEASRLGFEEPWAHPVTPEESHKAEWLRPKMKISPDQFNRRHALPRSDVRSSCFTDAPLNCRAHP